jgi:FKBP-type peptidyl-prolyl cis-trans isomerase FkpA
MKEKRDRFFALFGAILFMETATAFTIMVVWQMASNKGDSQNAASSQSSSNASGKQLQGTKLAGFTPVTEASELQKVDTKVGSGPEVKPGDTVTVDYTGAVAATGVIFQSSKDTGKPVTFPLDQVIKGWTDGVPGMKVGGTRRLVIPADQAYGANPPSGSGIPANAPLVFDITLYKIGS